jgi:hypothetical protein
VIAVERCSGPFAQSLLPSGAIFARPQGTGVHNEEESMRKTRAVFAAAAALTLGAPAAAHAATIPVQQISTGDFTASNSTVTKTPDGVHFGTYADAGAIGGSLLYHGLNGRTLSALTSFGMTFTYRERGATTGAAPYMRVFLDADPAADAGTTGDPDVDALLGFNDGIPNNDIEHDVVLDPGECGTNVPPQSTDVTANTANTTVRFDDDPCGTSPQEPYAAVLADPARAGLTIVDVLVSQGNSTGVDVSGLVRNITLNADTFAFNVPPVGPAGPAGTTVVQQVPVLVPAAGGTAVLGTQASRACRGAVLRRIHAPTRRGERFLRVAAALQTPGGLRSLKVRGRTVTVDLRNRPEANYNVRLISRYRTKSGKVRRVVTRRNLSVACS